MVVRITKREAYIYGGCDSQKEVDGYVYNVEFINDFFQTVRLAEIASSTFFGCHSGMSDVNIRTKIAKSLFVLMTFFNKPYIAENEYEEFIATAVKNHTIDCMIKEGHRKLFYELNFETGYYYKITPKGKLKKVSKGWLQTYSDGIIKQIVNQ
jgi:hypothetical protein